jgi:hypothetical protein
LNYFAQEQAPGAGAWPQWKAANAGAGAQYTPDPTAFAYSESGAQRWAFATYAHDFQLRVITASAASASVAKAGSAKTTTSDPVFAPASLPATPK